MTNTNDPIRQEEFRIHRKFKAFGPDVEQAITRVFGKFGHFRPLLSHLHLDADGNLADQEEVLLECLRQSGPARFMTGLELGKNPKTIVGDVNGQMYDQMATTLKVLASAEVPAEAVGTNTLASADADLDDIGTCATFDRRQKTPGRRQTVAIDFPNDRRKAPCRREN